MSQSANKIAFQRVIIGFLITVLIACFLFSKPVFPQEIKTYSPLGYNLIGGTSHVSGGLVDIQTDDSNYLSFASYPSTQTSWCDRNLYRKLPSPTRWFQDFQPRKRFHDSSDLWRNGGIGWKWFPRYSPLYKFKSFSRRPRCF